MSIKTKALLSAEEYSNILKIFKKNLIDLKKVIKDDIYYSKCPSVEECIAQEGPFIRLRVETPGDNDTAEKTFLMLRDKRLIDDHEFNYENKVELDNVDIIKELLISLDCIKYLTKHKDIWILEKVVNVDDQNIRVSCELEIVNYQFFYLEIRCLDSISPTLARKAIDVAFNSLGVSSSHYDSRDWQQILNF